MLPFVGFRVHFECLDGEGSFKVVLLSKVVLPDIRIVFGDLLVEWSGNLGTLVGEELNSLVPFTRIYRGLNGFLNCSCLNIMVDG